MSLISRFFFSLRKMERASRIPPERLNRAMAVLRENP